MSDITRAIPSDVKSFSVPIVDVSIGKHVGHKANIAYYFDEIKNANGKLKSARKAHGFYIDVINRAKAKIIDYCETFKCKSILTKNHKLILDSQVENFDEYFSNLSKAEKRKFTIQENK